MYKKIAVLLVSICLNACQAAAGPTLTNPGAEAQAAMRSPPEDCAAHVIDRFREKAGEIEIPATPDAGNFGGYFYYGPLSKRIRGGTIIVSCSDNYLNLPIPAGYTADWFGKWDVCLYKPCASLSFGGTGFSGGIKSTTWSVGVQYFLYLYTVVGGQLIESYPIGPLSTKKRNPGVLSFSSPFQNGFVYPYNDEVGLEIVHQLPSTHLRLRRDQVNNGDPAER